MIINNPALTGGAFCKKRILLMDVTLLNSFQGLRDSEPILNQVQHKVQKNDSFRVLLP